MGILISNDSILAAMPRRNVQRLSAAPVAPRVDVRAMAAALGRRLCAGVLCILAALFAFASCSKDSASDNDDTQIVRLVFNIDVGSASPATRANTDWTDYDSSEANAMENYIDVNSLHIFLYNSDGSFVASAAQISASPVGGSATQYRVLGTFDISTLSLPSYTLANAKVAVFANSRSDNSVYNGFIGQPLTADAIAGLNAGYDPSATLQSIPMYGVKTATLNLAPGNRNELDDIFMLRSLAKVEVSISQELQDRGYTLSAVSLKGYNPHYYELPAGYATISETRLLNYDSGTALSFHPYDADFNSADAINFAGSAAQSSTLYLPEATVDGTNRNVNISVTLSDKSGTETLSATFPFAVYSSQGVRTGTMNIVRNHYYKFEIIDSSLRVRVNVVPWTKFTHPDIVI